MDRGDAVNDRVYKSGDAVDSPSPDGRPSGRPMDRVHKNKEARP